MTPSNKSGSSYFIYFVPLAGLFLFLFSICQPIAESDPDRYFHLSIARMFAADPSLTVLPERVGWGNDYFLFSSLMGLAYRIGGDQAVAYLVPLIGLTLLFTLFLVVRTYVSPWAALLLTSCSLATPFFAARLFMLRPHLIAVELFLLICIFLGRRWTYATGIACFLFPLCYQVMAIPLATLGIAALTGLVMERRLLRAPLAGFAGLALGMVAHPSFPENVIGSFTTANAVLSHLKIDVHNAPVEALPLRPMDCLSLYGFYLAFVILALVLFNSKARKRISSGDGAPGYELVTFTMVALMLWGLTLLSRRAIEYAVPVTIILAAMVTQRVRGKLFLPAVALSALGLLVPGAITQYSNLQPVVQSKTRWEAIGAIPAEASGKKVFNCEWYVSPFLFYKRPDLRFVDLGDPAGLAAQSPQLYLMRETLRQGATPYPYGVIHFAFGADYALCENPSAIAQLEKDPYFKRLYPEKYTPFEGREVGALFLYELAHEPISNEVMDFLGSPLPASSNSDRQLEPKGSLEWKPVEFGSTALKASQRSPYIDLDRWMKYLGLSSGALDTAARCVALKPSLEEKRSHVGAGLIGVGGGKEVRLWWNGKQQVTSEAASPFPRLIQELVSLPRALRADDDITAVVCSPGNAPYFGFALSLWKNEELQKLCRDKTKGSDPRTCLGPIVSSPAR